MKRTEKSKSTLFLMEMVLVILFFAIASAVCVQLFVRAHFISAEGTDLTAAVREAQNAAEAFKAADGDPQRTASILGGELSEEDGGSVVTLNYGPDWQQTDITDRFRLELRTDGSDSALRAAAVTVYGPDGSIFDLEVKKYAG